MRLGVYLENETEFSIEDVDIWQIRDLNEIEKATVFLTDNKDAVKTASALKVPVIYYQTLGMPNVYEADITILSLSGLESGFLWQVYRRKKGLPWTIAQTDRIIIRESILEDFEGLYHLYEDAQSRRFLPPLDAKEREKEKLQAYITKQYPFYGYGLYTILEKETGEIIGRAGYENREYDGQVFLEIGYLIREDKRGCGYATETVLTLLKHLYDYTGEEEVSIFCHPDNQASVKVAKKAWEIYPKRVQIRFSS